ncbi:PREDICTED: LOW QUALITY PROTEIN: mucin-like protein [Branchiostoma belcheri]|uniref:LOW QUALITY PROTEIN: mucin-like protein n=1 Tax=Branchiostoma belcheri TaxID=7741 RepID=A0A6P4ZD52_BRABE|nr:PREDICTED: LOW QUALITY PROTEIN: mucin-like protein [Branchiostoma belcheri]
MTLRTEGRCKTETLTRKRYQTAAQSVRQTVSPGHGSMCNMSAGRAAVWRAVTLLMVFLGPGTVHGWTTQWPTTRRPRATATTDNNTWVTQWSTTARRHWWETTHSRATNNNDWTTQSPNTRRQWATTRSPWDTTRRQWDDDTTRSPWDTTRRQWATTRSPWDTTRRQWADDTTRSPWDTTRRQWADDTTRSPWDTTRRRWDTTRRQWADDTTRSPWDSTTRRRWDTTRRQWADTTRSPWDTTRRQWADTTRSPWDTTRRQWADTTRSPWDTTRRQWADDTTRSPWETTRRPWWDTTRRPSYVATTDNYAWTTRTQAGQQQWSTQADYITTDSPCVCPSGAVGKLRRKRQLEAWTDDGYTTEAAYATTDEQGYATADAQQYATTDAQQYATDDAQEYTTADAQEYTTTDAQQYGTDDAQEYTTADAQEYTTADAQEHTTADAQQYGTDDAQEYTTADAQEYTTTDAQQYGTDDAQEYTTADAQQYHTTADAQQYARTDAQQSTTADAQEYTTADAQQYATTNVQQYPTTANQYPTTAAQQYHTTANPYPTTDAQQYHTTANQYPTTAAQQHHTTANQYPTRTAQQYPTTDAQQYPTTANQYPTTGAQHYPTSSFDECVCEETTTVTTTVSTTPPEVDGCSETLNPCVHNATCADIPGPGITDANCTCGAGLEGDGRRDGTGCTDIDGCVNSGSFCAFYATCVDHPAPQTGATCRCDEGHDGDGRIHGTGCIVADDNLYPFGPSHGDREYADGTWYWSRCVYVYISPDGFPYFNRRHHRLYVCDNGVIQFDRSYRNSWPTKFGSAWYMRSRAMIAPFWAYSDPSSFSRFDEETLKSHIYYQVYKEGDGKIDTSTILTRASLDARNTPNTNVPSDFQATWVLVVTWIRLPPNVGCGSYYTRWWYSYYYCNRDLTSLEVNSFQAILITDGIYSFAKFVYPKNGIKWVYPDVQWRYYHYYSNLRGLPVAGYGAGDSYFYNYYYYYWSWGYREHFYNVPKSGTLNMRNIDEVPGNTGETGVSIYRLENSDGSIPPTIYCRRWYYSTTPAWHNWGYHRLTPCPCSRQQARRDDRYYYSGNDCWTSLSTRFGLRQKCCYTPVRWYYIRRWYYSWWSGRYVSYYSWFRTGGFLIRWGRNAGHVIVNWNDDHIAQRKCCQESYSNCHLFRYRRPTNRCWGYRPPWRRWFWGDPHIITLDGKGYTFNGLGEYLLFHVDDGNYTAQVQARTNKAPGSDKATVFTAVVVSENNGLGIQLNINNQSEAGMDLYINGTLQDILVYDNTTSNHTLLEDVLFSRPTTNSFKIQLSSGISLTTTSEKNMLAVVVSAPDEYMNSTQGLLGYWDGDETNDFTAFNGSVLHVNSSESDIFKYFGQSFDGGRRQVEDQVPYLEGESLESMRDTSFSPGFTDAVTFDDPVLEAEARAICGDDQNCLFDISQTGDPSVGETTKTQSDTLTEENNQLANFPPEVDGPDEVNATMGEVVNIRINASDANGDDITFDLDEGVPEFVSMDADGDSANITWNVTSGEQFDLKVILTDTNNGSTQYWPTVRVCACYNGGTCVDSDDDDDTSSDNSTETRFILQGCTCDEGYTGVQCESDIDACEENSQPCYEGVRCRDYPAPANISGYECGPCPTGFTGDGETCEDINECNTTDSDVQTCAQICVNYPGSFACDCQAGYQLNSDGLNCDDVNECEPAHDCGHQCHNDIGSYHCSCNSGFELATDNKTCSPISQCTAEREAECDAVNGGCYAEWGTQTCYCNKGYTLNGDDCEDVDECSSGENRCNQECVNTIGGYNCSCEDGYRTDDSDPYTCQDIDECFEDDYNCTDTQLCVNRPGDYACACLPGLVEVDGDCTDLPDDEKPVMASNRVPTSDEKKGAVVFTADMAVSQYTVSRDLAFSKAVAIAATSHCSSHAAECGLRTDSSRRRRETVDVEFTELNVLRLPNYPVELSSSSIQLALYVLLPDSLRADNTTMVIPGQELITIIENSIQDLSTALGGVSITDLYLLILPTTPLPTTTVRATAAQGDNTAAIAGGIVAGLVILAVIVVVIVVLKKKKARMTKVSDSQTLELAYAPSSSSRKTGEEEAPGEEEALTKIQSPF